MGKPELRKELEALDNNELGMATAHVLRRSLDPQETVVQLDALRSGYPALFAAAGVVAAHAEDIGKTPEQVTTMMTGAVALALALREVIELDAMPPLSTNPES